MTNFNFIYFPFKGNVLYLISINTESLTGPEAIKRACEQFLRQLNRKLGVPTEEFNEFKTDLKRNGSIKKKRQAKDSLNDNQITYKFSESFSEAKANLKANNQIDADGIVVYFKVSSKGISLTDNTHR